jgi:hypothetical protein
MYWFVVRVGLPLALGVSVMATPIYAATPQPPLAVQIKDQCDPATFNAAVGAGTCQGNGAVTFQQFLNELNVLHFAPQWQFVPSQSQMTAGQTFVATNMGGEVHSFTEVDKFGGGVIPLLNQLSNSGATVPECSAAFAAFQAGTPDSSFLFPGQAFTDTEGADDVGHPVLYQCCIHPWMHETITVRTS